jgi:hypothetical protein
VLLLSPVLQVRAQTPQTQRYLQFLVPPGAAGQPPVPVGAYNGVAQLLATEAGADANLPLARVHLASGRWLTLRAARMDTAQPAAGRDIAVSIEPAAPHDRVVVFARASGLSTRDTQLPQHLVTGVGTHDLARHMFVFENTVQDHLKSIFTKTATRNPAHPACPRPRHLIYQDLATRNPAHSGHHAVPQDVQRGLWLS